MVHARSRAPVSGSPPAPYSTCALHTDVGEFQLTVYRAAGPPGANREHVVIHQGDPGGAEDFFVRIHSECFTGEVLGSLHCDCRSQFTQALERISAIGAGAVVYLRQEGRGIGLGNKVRAYHLQRSHGLDTVDANLALGFEVDLRDFDLAAQILRSLGVVSVRLNTNNLAKIEALESVGIRVTQRIPSRPQRNAHNAVYLDTKRNRLGHLL